MESEAHILLAAVALAAFVASVARWRLGVAGALVLVVFEGALRKWVLPEAQASLYLAKDILLLGAYVGFAASRGFGQPVRQAEPFLVLLVLAIAYGTLELLNPALPSAALALVGWRSYFFYVPLLFLVPHLFASFESLYRGLTRYALLAALIAALGVLQFYSPMDSVLNANVQHEPGTASVVGFAQGKGVRVAGTFAFISGFAAYLLAAALLIAALLAARGWRIRQNIALYGALGLVVAAMFATGSRGPVYSLVAAAAAYVVFAVAKGDLPAATGLRALAAVAALGMALWYFLPGPADAFGHRAASIGSDDALTRVLWPLVEPFNLLGEAGVFGFGIGAAHQSAAFLVGSGHSWWTNGLVAEAETSRVMLEFGMVGFVLVFLLRILIAVAALRAAFTLRSPPARALALVLALYLATQIFGSVIFNPTNNVLYWFAVGLLFALYRLQAREARVPNSARVIPQARLERSV